VAQANVKLTVNATQATSALKGVQNQTTQLNAGVNRLKTAIAGIGLTLLARNAVTAASDFQALQLRMKVLTSEFGEFAGAQELVRKAQDKFNLSIVEATRGITDIFARLRPLNVSLGDIETAFFGFNSVAKLAGLNAAEASAAFTQLAQALGSGRLQGDEFRSIAEQVPGLLKSVSDETGIATGKLKDFASKGLLTSDILLRALAKSAKEGDDKIKDIIDQSPAEAFKKFNNAVLELQLNLGSKLVPLLADAAENTALLVDQIIKFTDSDLAQAVAVISGIVLAVKGLSVVAPIAIGALVNFIGQVQLVAIKSQIAAQSLTAKGVAANFATVSVSKLSFALTAFKIALAKTGIGVAVIALGAFVTKLIEAINAQKEFNRLIKEGEVSEVETEISKLEKEVSNLEKALSKTNPVFDFFTNQFFGLGGSDNITAQIAAANKKLTELRKRLADAKAEKLTKEFEKAKEALEKTNSQLKDNIEKSKLATDEERKKFDINKKFEELVKQFGIFRAQELIDIEKANQGLKDKNELIKKNNEEANKLKEKFKSIGEEIETSIKDNLREAITGAQSFGQAMTNVLNRIRDKIIDAQLDRLIGQFGENFGKSASKRGSGKGIGGFVGNILGGLFGRRANGGPVAAGKSFVVGEKGPEILTMGSSRGFVTANDKIGGGSVSNMVTVNVDASGSSVSGNNADAQALGAAIGAAVQAQLIKEKRPGGILTR